MMKKFILAVFIPLALLICAPAYADPPPDQVAAPDASAINNIITTNFTDGTNLGWLKDYTSPTPGPTSWSSGLNWDGSSPSQINTMDISSQALAGKLSLINLGALTTSLCQ